MTESFRPLSDFERSVIARLLDSDARLRDRFRDQLTTALVRPWLHCTNHCASIEFNAGDDAQVDVPSTPLPVDGSFTDTDGVPVEILLFERAGRLTDLEFVVYSDRMKRKPAAEEIEVRSTSSTAAGRKQHPNRAE